MNDIPSVPSAGHFHAVRFYDNHDALCRIVGQFIAEGLREGAPAIMIVTPDHCHRLESCLVDEGFDIAKLKRTGDLTILEADETLATFMVDGLPNADAFRYSVGEAVRQVGRGREGFTLRAYGEMVDVLWKAGMEAAAIRLETLWNQLANTHDFKLLCGYSMGNFYKGPALDDIKRQHSHLMAETGEHISLQ